MSARLLASQHARPLAPLVIRLVSRFVSNLLTTLGMRTMGSSDFIAAFTLLADDGRAEADLYYEYGQIRTHCTISDFSYLIYLS